MESTVAALLASGKKILAADESFPTIEKRSKALAMSCTEENRHAGRERLFTTPGLNEFVGGAILFDETIRQKTTDGIPVSEVLAKQGIVPGINVDKEPTALANFVGGKTAQGLDGLHEWLIDDRPPGARFTKWRAVIGIGGRTPSFAVQGKDPAPSRNDRLVNVVDLPDVRAGNGTTP
jgi:fructose-bisphosphate aldolase class I